jgi:hypothetical protein
MVTDAYAKGAAVAAELGRAGPAEDPA